MRKAIIWTVLLAMIAVFVTGCGQTGKKENVGEKDTVEEAASVEAQEETTSQGSEAPADDDLSRFAGDWYVDGLLGNGHYSITADGHVESYSYDGMCNFEGELKREEYENPDGTKGYLYNIYDDGGEFVIGFYEPEEKDFYELYSGQDGEYHYVRSDHCTEGGGPAY